MKKSGAIVLIIVLTLVLTSVLLIAFPKFDPTRQREKEEETQESEEEETTYSYTIADAFITNIKDSKRFVKASITIEVGAEETVAELELQEYVVKDTVLKILRTTTEEEITSPDSQEVLSETIKQQLSATLGIDTIKKIYFMELVVQ